MPEIGQYNNLSIVPVMGTIESGETKSDSIKIGGTTLVKIYMPVAFTGTSISFEVSSDCGATFQPYYNIKNELVSYDVLADRCYGLAPIDFYGVTHFKIVSNAAEGADRSFTLVSGAV